MNVWNAGRVISGWSAAVGYPHRDHISVALWWPAASLLGGVHTANCTKLPVQAGVGSEKSPEALEWSHLGYWLIAIIGCYVSRW